MKTFKIRSRSVIATFVFTASGLTACGGPTVDETAGSDLPDETVGTTEQALDLCSIINPIRDALGAIGGSSVNVTPYCDDNSINNTHFNGSGQINQTLNDLFVLPYVTNGAYFCGVADSDGVTAKGTLDSGLGRFGLDSRFTVLRRDPSAQVLNTQRIGTFYLFGAPVDIEVQDIDWTFKSEQTPDKKWWGGYMTVNSRSKDWGIDGSVRFPVGPIMVTVRPSLHSKGPTLTQTNNAIKFASGGTASATNQLAAAYKYDAWLACVTFGVGCPNNLVPRSAVSTSDLIANHAAACPADVASTTDGILPYKNPYGGAACKTQNWIFLDTLHNWFQFGRPTAGPGEPRHWLDNTDRSNLDTGNATMWANLGIEAAFDAGIAKISLDTNVSLAARDGFTVRQVHDMASDGSVENVDFATELSAQSRAALTIKAMIELTGWLPPISYTFTIPLGERNQTSTGTVARYDDRDHTQFSSYKVKGQAVANPDQARLQCMTSTTPVTKPAPPAGQPAAFLKNVAAKAVDAIHPCLVKICADNVHQVEYKWDSAQKKLVVDKTLTGCTICSKIEGHLCDASGNILKDGNGRSIGFVNGRVTPVPAGCSR